MDSPSSGSTGHLAPFEDQAGLGAASQATTGPGVSTGGDLVAIAGFGDATAADFAAFVGGKSGIEAVLVAAEGSGVLLDGWVGPEPASLILFLPPRLSEPDRRRLADLVRRLELQQELNTGVVEPRHGAIGHGQPLGLAAEPQGDGEKRLAVG